jgi:DNA topoisomerase I
MDERAEKKEMQALIFIEANGKAAAWRRIAAQLGMTATVIPTTGHVCSFPNTLFPIGIDLSRGAVLETRRRPDPERRERILQAVAKAGPRMPILLAMDNDVEGDVIAYDVADLIFKAHPERQATIFRIRPGPITTRGMRAALSGAVSMHDALDDMTHDAIPGRARAVTDRWIGATFSRLAGVPVGRVRSAVLGATFLNAHRPELLRGRPETGEITFQARASFGGRPFVARVPLDGSGDMSRITALMRLAREWSGKLIPGTVRALQPAGAAIAPRIGAVRPFNTADALVYAARHHGTPVKAAMQGLQDAYLKGLISYPRTDSREVSLESASRVVWLGFGCGLDGLDHEVLGSQEIDDAIEADGIHDSAHEALHPVVAATTRNTEQMRSFIRRPLPRIPEGGEWDRSRAMELMTILVTRRAFEAAMDLELERGNWSPDNSTQVSPEDEALLRDLDWTRESGFTFPWSRNFMTSVKQWPLDAVLLETMAIEGIGRPSTYASHVGVAERSGDIEMGEFPAPPRPTPQGARTLQRTPRAVWTPAICRLIEDALENRGNKIGEDASDTLPRRARHRILYWLRRIPEEMRGPLLAALEHERGGRKSGVRKAPVAIDLSEMADGLSDLPEPTPPH